MKDASARERGAHDFDTNLVVEAGASIVVKRMTREFSERLAARCAGTAQVGASAQ